MLIYYMKKVYIFDLDGTLVNSMPYYTKGTLSVLDDEGIPYEPELINVLTPLGYTKTAEYYIEKMGVKGTVEEIVERLKKKLVYEYTYNIKLKPFVGEYLRKLKAEGAQLYVLTASPHIVTDVCLQRNGVYDLFDEVWSVEDYGLSKSGTELFFKVAERVGCEMSDVHYFDDNTIAVINSHKAGFKVYGVLDIQPENEVEIVRQNCDVFVESFEQLM